MDNAAIARLLTLHAERLDQVDPNLYRRRAYRRAAEAVLTENMSVEQCWRQQGRRGLRTIPGVGVRLARAIEALLRAGEIPLPRSVILTAAGEVVMTTVGK